ncbi:hypothetical protein LVD15_23190 [Fulvivirga maritima]|uniref:hypothetical protein n=1 Tax=Fulvivirga maritima TaxID=2904247 RepID=UPI001F2EB85E|nr:hypothetical protein [Fulvivirga maritima]UII26175.1 hypothetical protein LVD15_23190 [Fulvivirga maritima]
MMLLFGWYKGYVKRKSIRSYPAYTIGITPRLYLTAKGGRSVAYTYVVNGVEYKSSTSYAYEAKVPGGRYLVKFSYERPNNSQIYLDYELPEHLKIPEKGWAKPPYRSRL